MKEVKEYSDGSCSIEIIPTCDTCRFRRSQVEAIGQNISGMVDSCKKGKEEMAYPGRCDEYQKKLTTAIAEFFYLV